MTRQARVRRDRRHKFMERFANDWKYDRRRRSVKLAEARMLWDRALRAQSTK